MKQELEFEKTEKGIVLMAQFLAELVRQGVVFHVISHHEDKFVIVFTGGF